MSCFIPRRGYGHPKDLKPLGTVELLGSLSMLEYLLKKDETNSWLFDETLKEFNKQVERNFTKGYITQKNIKTWKKEVNKYLKKKYDREILYKIFGYELSENAKNTCYGCGNGSSV